MYLIFLVHYLVILCQIKVFKVSSDAKNEKGTSVRVRDYTRSCEFYSVLYTLNDHCLWGGKVVQTKQVRRPAFICVLDAFGR